MKTAEFGQPCAAVPQPGRCRICGCTDDQACALPVYEEQCIGDNGDHSECPVQIRYGSRPCGWVDETRTLCDAPACVAAAKRELGLQP